MKFMEYVKDRMISIIIYVITVVLLICMLSAFKMPVQLEIIVVIMFGFSGVLILLISFFRKNKFYKSLITNLEILDKKYLILETIDMPSTYEEKVIVELLYDINKSMIEDINVNRDNINDFKEFVEMWIHEVKIPISSMVLKCYNGYDESFLRLIRRLDNDIDKVLYYVRLGDTEKDFVIGEVNLKEVIRGVGIKNKDDLLESNIGFYVDLKAYRIRSDKKWLEFILNQIINNCIKYKKDEGSIIRITSRDEKDKSILEIYDNGVGIPQKDIHRVFDKSFTGTNGRNKVKSTGMGLYITKKLCDKLGAKIYIESKESEYTKVILEFGKNDMYSF